MGNQLKSTVLNIYHVIDVQLSLRYRNGSFKKGDELLMINGKSVVGYRVADVVKILKEAESSITIMVASKVYKMWESMNNCYTLIYCSQMKKT